MISPDSLRNEGVKWYSGTSGRDRFDFEVGFDTDEALRFMITSNFGANHFLDEVRWHGAIQQGIRAEKRL
jgi:hypothetical protein